MEIDDLGPAERFAAGAVGNPGERRFYLEVVADGTAHSLLAEKQQIAALAARGLEILDEHEISSDGSAVDRLVDVGLPISDPGDGNERFRVGTISIAMAPSELLTVTIESVEEDDAVTFVIAPEQFQAMATVALDVVAAGRPMCPWCRLPMDPENHECPARN
jgi:uncharacterized repeat protein (TIGR03847 family)